MSTIKCRLTKIFILSTKNLIYWKIVLLGERTMIFEVGDMEIRNLCMITNQKGGLTAATGPSQIQIKAFSWIILSRLLRSSSLRKILIIIIFVDHGMNGHWNCRLHRVNHWKSYSWFQTWSVGSHAGTTQNNCISLIFIP